MYIWWVRNRRDRKGSAVENKNDLVGFIGDRYEMSGPRSPCRLPREKRDPPSSLLSNKIRTFEILTPNIGDNSEPTIRMPMYQRMGHLNILSVMAFGFVITHVFRCRERCFMLYLFFTLFDRIASNFGFALPSTRTGRVHGIHTYSKNQESGC